MTRPPDPAVAAEQASEAALWVALGGLASPATSQLGPPLPCTFGACANLDHRHEAIPAVPATSRDASAVAVPTAMRCPSCEAPLHFVFSANTYRHDDPNLGCLLLDPTPPSTP